MTRIVALDIGGTKIEGVLLDAKLHILKRVRKPTSAGKSRATTVNNIVAVIEELRHGAVPIGISMAGYRNNYGNPNIPKLLGFDLERFLRRKFGKVLIANDAQCFALAEQRLGAAKGRQNVVGVILGTGVGGGVIVDGRLLHGRDDAAGHIGHMIIDPSGRTCRCGQRGDFEAWCAGPHIVARYREKGGMVENSSPSLLWKSKDTVAKAVVRETVQKMGIGFANLASLYNPEVIVVGGGLSNLPLYAALQQELKKYSSLGLGKNVKILKNRLGDAAGVYGAAMLVRAGFRF